MTLYPFAIDSDSSIVRIDDNLSELGTEAINQIRSAIFAIEAELGVTPSGSTSSVAARFDVAHNPDGTIKASALTSVGLATLPITNNQVANTAGIKEFKLDLDFNTADLNTLILANKALLDTVAAFAATTNADLLIHIGGGVNLSDGSTAGRHVASQIDLNSTPSDTRDPTFVWSGLLDKDGDARSATEVATGLLQVNNALTTHENLTTDAHPATAISVDTDEFTELPTTVSNVQEALDALDDADRLQIGIHRSIQHSNGIPPTARSESFVNPDGYNQTVVEPTRALTFLVDPPLTAPVDSTSSGDDIIKFSPEGNSGFVFDAQFSQVVPGDIIRINYGGVEASYPIDEKRHIPGTEWIVRINGINLFNKDGYDGYAYARIDRPLFDDRTHGVLAPALSTARDINTSISDSIILGHPRAASALGIDFDPNKLDSSHYNLWLQLYPDGDPSSKSVDLPAIDVTGNAGITPGQYTLASVVEETNKKFREGGYNYRFIAYERKGQFGIMLADPRDNAAFSIVNGTLSGSSLITGSFTDNVIGDASDGLDPLGFGVNKAAVASPAFTGGTFTDSTAALNPTKVIVPLKKRNYIVNGVRLDDFENKPFTVDDGYWDATITNRTVIGITTVETEYTINLNLSTAGLAPGKTLVVQPTVAFADGSYNDNDYGRFIIKSVAFPTICPGDSTGTTIITVVNSVHGDGDPVGSSSSAGLDVRIYFGEDSVSFNNLNAVDAVTGGLTYNRLHEIFVTGEATSFSHERARMPKQAQTSTLLGTTDRWTIKDISHKLRGFPDSASSNLRRYVRFYVLSYNSTTGEYDGYIGRPSGTDGITDTGNVVTGRKNVTARFFDTSNIDYIDIQFFDETSSPGVDIMSTDAPRFVDIEIFPSLATNDEYLRVATCEVDDLLVQCVTDRREFGSISEKDFTNSALEFISATDRFVHENGALRGLEFLGVDPSDNRILSFSGGFALVNGKAVPVNNGSVAIPEVRETGAALPAEVTWAVCINEEGNFEPIIITSTKKQFFATTGGTDYYVPSVTFDELISTRKDLTFIAEVVATISSISLAVSDGRRFVVDSGFNGNVFTVVSDNNQLAGSFKSFTAVATWIRNSGASRHVVSVRGGDIDVDTGADFSDFNGKEVIFDGTDMSRSSSSTATLLFDTGTITITDDITFKNIDIQFGSSATTTITFGDRVVFDNCSITSSPSVVDFLDFTLGTSCRLLDSTLTVETGNFTFGGATEIDRSTITYDTATAPTIGGLSSIKNSSITVGDLNSNTGIGIGPITVIDSSTFDSGDAHKCLSLTASSSVLIKNSTFTYGPTGLSYGALNRVNILTSLSEENACIFGSSGLSNITVQDCSFLTPSGFSETARPPYIGFVVNQNESLETLRVERNQFIDIAAHGQLSAVAVLNRQALSGFSALIANSRITDNVCNQEQNIVLTTSSDLSFDIVAPGLACVNTIISGNKCGNIGYVISSDNAFGENARGQSNAIGLTIEKNQARIIGNLDSSGNFKYADATTIGGTGGDITHDTGNVIVRGNSCNWILTSAVSTDHGGSEKSGTLLIDGNTIDGYSSTFLTNHGATTLGVPLDIAIYVASGFDQDGYDTDVRVVNNVTNFGYTDLGVTQFDYALSCIRVDVAATITGNTLRGITSDASGAIMINVSNDGHTIINSNRLFRGSNDIYAYIATVSTTNSAIVTDNIFDSPVTSGLISTTVNIPFANKHWVMERNINQTFIVPVNGSTGVFGITSGSASLYDVTANSGVTDTSMAVKKSIGTPITSLVRVAYAGSATTRSHIWYVPTESILPRGVKILNFGATVEADDTAATTGAVTLRLTNADGTVETTSTAVDFTGAYVPNTPVATTINFFSPDTKHLVGTNSVAQIVVDVNHSGALNVSIYSVFFTYRW